MTLWTNDKKRFEHEATRIAKVVTGPDMDEMFGKDETIIPSKTSPQLEKKTGSLEKRLLMLDPLPAENGAKKKQTEWIQYWFGCKDDRMMASMPDYYQAFKQLREYSNKGSARQKAETQEMLSVLKDAFDYDGKSNWTVSSTRIEYDYINFNAKIIHHYECKDQEKIEEELVEIPNCSGGKALNEVLKSETGLNLLQVLFDTDDNAKKITQTLEYISDKKAEEIYITTPNQQSREDYPNRAAGFSFSQGNFNVHADNAIDGSSLSFGAYYEED